MATVEEVFAKVAAHMVEGLMLHDQMSSYYDFLNLEGYAKCHEYHYWCENKNYICLKHYYTKHHSKLLKEIPVTDPSFIPAS